MQQNIRIGIAFSGGGARGIAHIGALKALEEAGIKPEVLSGTSAGAIVGCLYAYGLSIDKMLEFIKDTQLFGLIKLGLPKAGLTKLTYLKERLTNYIEEDRFEALQKPLYVAISNLNTGELEIKHSGPLFEVIMASSSIPLVFKPVEIDGEIYVDGGLLNNLPVSPLLPHTDFIIGVNVMPHLNVPNKSVQSLFGIATRCFDLSIQANSRPELALCDVVIEPKKCNGYHLFHINKYQEIFDIGYEEAKKQIPKIKKKLQALENSEKQKKLV